MTAPIQEPTVGRTTSGLGYGQRQLFRRPGPRTDAGSVSWGRANAEINSSAVDYVEPDFNTDTNATFERTDDGRFHINADGRFVLEAGNEGTYVMAVNIFDIEGASNADTYVQVLLDWMAPKPGGSWMLPGWFDTGADTSAYEMTFPLLQDFDNTNVFLVAAPNTQIMYLFESDEDLVIRLRCAVIEDGNQVAEGMNIVFSMVRIGNATLDVDTGSPFS